MRITIILRKEEKAYVLPVSIQDILKFNCPNKIKPKRALTITKEKQEGKRVYEVFVPDVNKEDNYEFYISTNDTPEYQGRVLIDSGSELNFIDPNFAKKNDIKMSELKESFRVAGVGNEFIRIREQTEKCMLRRRNHLEVLPPHRKYDCEIKFKENFNLFYGPLYPLM
ncbi:hypothetical protein PIROE2DRAFT_40809 [Piromyces sp. E2]|nr:hypothetical protein PIROE2DRAFT_40809 [Piromyces sp. E2]|eukprot:OUM66406.1 hypothetical protein PIROE2DRAFT_40809 [Piromyces sp. E2]